MQVNRKILVVGITLLLLASVSIVIWFTPVTLLRYNTENVVELCIKNGNNGKTVTFASGEHKYTSPDGSVITISDQDVIEHVVTALSGEKFRRTRIRIGLGWSFDITFTSDQGKAKTLVLQSPTEVKRGIFRYSPVNSECLSELYEYLSGITE